MADVSAVLKALAALSGGGSAYFSELQEGREREDDKKRQERLLQLQEEQAARAQTSFEAEQEDRRLARTSQATDIISQNLDRLNTRVTPGGAATRIEGQGPKGVASEAIALPVEEKTGAVTPDTLKGAENLVSLVAANTGLKPEQIRELFPGASIIADSAKQARRQGLYDELLVNAGFDPDDPGAVEDFQEFATSKRELGMEAANLELEDTRSSIALRRAQIGQLNEAKKEMDPERLAQLEGQVREEIAVVYDDIVSTEGLEIKTLEDKANVWKRASLHVADRYARSGIKSGALVAEEQGLSVAQNIRRRRSTPKVAEDEGDPTLRPGFRSLDRAVKGKKQPNFSGPGSQFGTPNLPFRP